jgi:hypothetical protein
VFGWPTSFAIASYAPKEDAIFSMCIKRQNSSKIDQRRKFSESAKCRVE